MRNTTLVYSSLGVTSVATGVILSFLPLFIFDISKSEFLAASVTSIPALSAIVASPIWGVLRDKTGKNKALMLVSIVPYAALSFFLIFTRDVVQILIALSASALLISASTPVFSSFVTAGSEKRGTSLGLLAASGAIGGAIGGFVGGITYQWYDIRLAFLLGGVSAVIAALIIGFGLKQDSSAMAGDQSSPNHRVSTLKVLRNRRILSPCISCFTYMIGATAFSSLASIYVVNTLGGSKLLWGISSTLAYLVGAATIAPTGIISDKIGRKPIIRIGLISSVALFTSFLFLKDPLVVSLLYIAPLAYIVCTTITTIITDVTAEGERGKGIGVQNSWLNAGGVIGPLLGGAVAQAISIQIVLASAIAILLFSIAWSELEITETKIADPELFHKQ